MDEKWRIEVDHGACVGTGLCADAEPDCFKIEGGRSVVLRSLVEANERYLDVVEDCPVGAVSVYDAVTGARIDPGSR